VAPFSINEFSKNKTRLIEDSVRTASVRRDARSMADKSTNLQKPGLIDEIENIDHQVLNLGDRASEIIGRIEILLETAELHDHTDAIKVRALDRALNKIAPFHRERNGISEAILVELYADMVADNQGVHRFAFVTHNTKDFSSPTANQKIPHPDLVHLFPGDRSRYFVTMGEALRSIRPDQFANLMIEQEWSDKPRRKIADIVKAENRLTEIAWYRQHMRLREEVTRGNIRVGETAVLPSEGRSRNIQRDIWETAIQAAEKIERRHGLANRVCWSEFGWGMLIGKLSALRWVLGDEWDFSEE
jgi:hypothetical protein